MDNYNENRKFEIKNNPIFNRKPELKSKIFGLIRPARHPLSNGYLSFCLNTYSTFDPDLPFIPNG